MKRLIFLLLLIPALAFADATSDYSDLFTENQQAQDVIKAYGILQGATMEIETALAQIQEIKDAGTFNTIDADLKAALIRWEQLLKDFRSGMISDSEVLTLYQFRP